MVPHACKLSESAAIPAHLAETGLPDILVNNAGAILAGSLETIKETHGETPGTSRS